MRDFANALIQGIETGSLYALIALGLNVVYATTRVFNFAHGSLVMAGAVGGAVAWQSFHVPVIGALVIVIVGIAGIGTMIERLAVRPAMRNERDASGWVLSTLAVSIIITAIFSLLLNRRPGFTGTVAFPSFLPTHRTFRPGQILLNPSQILVVIVMVLAATALVLFEQRTSYGRAMKAVADDHEGAAARGLPVNRLIVMSFAIGAALAAIAGFIAGPVTQASLSVGLPLTLAGFTAAAIGGIPTYSGAVVGGILLGLVEQMTAQYTDGRLIDLITLALLLVVLSLRPQGILGRNVRIV